MKTYRIIMIILTAVFFSQLSAQDEMPDAIEFSSVQHGTMVIKASDVSIYVDPVGDVKAFGPFPSPDIILITDIHGDHLDAVAVNALKQDNTLIVAPKQTNLRNGLKVTLCHIW